MACVQGASSDDDGATTHLLPHAAALDLDDTLTLEDPDARRWRIDLKVGSAFMVGEEIGQPGLSAFLRPDDEHLGRL